MSKFRFLRLVIVVACALVVTEAAAKVYRAGLAGGFINSYDGNSYHTTSIPDIGYFSGPIAGLEKSSNVSRVCHFSF